MSDRPLLSVGIDIGTTTTQLVFSHLTVQNESPAFTVPHFAITKKDVLYRSKIHFTPLLSDTVIDTEGVRKIVDAEYAASGFAREDVQTGAVIITGETARKENAAEVLRALSGYAGDFVVATAGPALESVLAGKGSGAQKYSQEHQCAVLNFDIGGGTTNLALFDCGRLVDTGCLNVGGRLMKFSPDGTLTYLSPVLRPYFDFRVGQKLCVQVLQPVISLLVSVLEWVINGKETGFSPADFITDKAIRISGTPLLTFSGGVADLIRNRPEDPFAYGDLGVLLGEALCRSFLCKERFLQAAETIRATVIGAGTHTTELSGSTIFYRNICFPMKNLPVAQITTEEEALEPAALGRIIRSRAAIYRTEHEPFVLGMTGSHSPKFSELCKLADGIADGISEEPEQPLLLALREDMGKALGQALAALLPKTPLLCLDGISLSEGSYLDIGSPVAGGQVLPVVIKTLALG